jgi:hypothetical protein|tara:strand:- start:624 stop:935 length:312 start_codon:yes stop_codon:yes gene_type:complete
VTVYLLQSKRHPFIIERDASALDVDVDVDRSRTRRPFPDEPRVGVDADRARARSRRRSSAAARVRMHLSTSHDSTYTPLERVDKRRIDRARDVSTTRDDAPRR